jgi:hypothetical protein
MIRLSWRQFRSQAGVALTLLVLVAILFAATGPHHAHLYNVYDQAQAACAASGNCRQVTINIGQFDRLLELIGTALVAVPALIGAFWGAPLIARSITPPSRITMLCARAVKSASSFPRASGSDGNDFSCARWPGHR